MYGSGRIVTTEQSLLTPSTKTSIPTLLPLLSTPSTTSLVAHYPQKNSKSSGCLMSQWYIFRIFQTFSYTLYFHFHTISAMFYAPFLCSSHLTYDQFPYLNLILTNLSFQTTSLSFPLISPILVTNITPSSGRAARGGTKKSSPAGRSTT